MSPLAAPRAAPQAGPSCPYCAGQELAPWLHNVTDHLQRASGTWSFLRCRACGSAVLHPAPRPEDLAALYPEVYSFHPGVARGSGPWGRIVAALEERLFFRAQYRAQLRLITRAIGAARPDSTLLDLGCGIGQRLLSFRRLGYTVHGLDFQQPVVDYLRDQLGVAATCGDLGALRELFEPASFDVVTAFQVLEHVPSVRSLMGDVFRSLKPGGWFVATVPMGDSFQADVLGARWCGVREAPRHLSLPSHTGLQKLADHTGFARSLLRPDSLLSCAGLIGLSLFPGAATATVYGRKPPLALLGRALGAGVTLAALPWCLIENYALERPGTAFWLAQKPA